MYLMLVQGGETPLLFCLCISETFFQEHGLHSGICLCWNSGVLLHHWVSVLHEFFSIFSVGFFFLLIFQDPKLKMIEMKLAFAAYWCMAVWCLWSILDSWEETFSSQTACSLVPSYQPLIPVCCKCFTTGPMKFGSWSLEMFYWKKKKKKKSSC